MKFIRTFEAKKRKNKDDIWEFCESHLIPLLDDITFKYDIETNSIKLINGSTNLLYNSTNKRCNLISLYKERIVSVSRYGDTYNERRPLKFKWDDIKDDIIPFIMMSEHVYGLVNEKQSIIFQLANKIVCTSINEIDKIEPNFEFWKLYINISNK